MKVISKKLEHGLVIAGSAALLIAGWNLANYGPSAVAAKAAGVASQSRSTVVWSKPVTVWPWSTPPKGSMRVALISEPVGVKTANPSNWRVAQGCLNIAGNSPTPDGCWVRAKNLGWTGQADFFYSTPTKLATTAMGGPVPTFDRTSHHTCTHQIPNQGGYTQGGGQGSGTACGGGMRTLNVYVASPRPVGTPVVINLHIWDTRNATSMRISGGKLQPVSPWIVSQDPSMNGTPGAEEMMNESVSAIAPPDGTGLPSQQHKTEVATWLWYPNNAASILTVGDLPPINIPAAVAAIPGLTVSPAEATALGFGASLWAPAGTQAAALAQISAAGISGSESVTSSGDAKVVPTGSQKLSLNPGNYSWKNPQPGQSIQFNVVIKNVPQAWHAGGWTQTFDLSLNNGAVISHLGISAPVRTLANRWVPLTVSITQNGQVVSGQTVNLRVTGNGRLFSSTIRTGKVGRSGGDAVFSGTVLKPVAVVASAAGTTRSVSTVVYAPRQFDWFWIVLPAGVGFLLLALALAMHRQLNRLTIAEASEVALPNEFA